MATQPNPAALQRVIKTPGAVLMGLGSIVGTGIFVSIAIATQVAGTGIILAIAIAALLATFNGLSSAQLAAAHPVSGGTYEYGYRFLGSYFGFTAGWMFMIAKSASAATAVLGCVGYVFYALDVDAGRWVHAGAGLALLAVMTWLVSGGIQRSNNCHTVIVGVPCGSGGPGWRRAVVERAASTRFRPPSMIPTGGWNSCTARRSVL